MNNNFSYWLYSDEVRDNDNSVQCGLCNKQNYTGYLNIGAEKYEKLQNDLLPWYSPNYAVEVPLSTLSNKL